ncbi:hypothetical protein RI367_007455 [Sorochytrium milnesiophthora]
MSGFQSFNSSALDTLADVHTRYLSLLVDHSRSACELSGRTELSISDVARSFRMLGIQSEDLQMYLGSGWTTPLVDLPPTPGFPVDTNGDVSCGVRFTPITVDPHLILDHLCDPDCYNKPLLIEPDVDERQPIVAALPAVPSVPEIALHHTELDKATNGAEQEADMRVVATHDLPNPDTITAATTTTISAEPVAVVVDNRQTHMQVDDVEPKGNGHVKLEAEVAAAAKRRTPRAMGAYLRRRTLEQKLRRAKNAAAVAATQAAPSSSHPRKGGSSSAALSAPGPKRTGKGEHGAATDEPPTTLTTLKLLHRKPTLLATFTSDSLFASPSASLDELNSLLPSVTLGMTSEERQKKKDQTYCICENPTVDFGQFMLSCDTCKVWYHGSCVEVYEGMVKENDRWYCPRCRQKGIVPAKT